MSAAAIDGRLVEALAAPACAPVQDGADENGYARIASLVEALHRANEERIDYKVRFEELEKGFDVLRSDMQTPRLQVQAEDVKQQNPQEPPMTCGVAPHPLADMLDDKDASLLEEAADKNCAFADGEPAEFFPLLAYGLYI
jgi:hypothetical protein